MHGCGDPITAPDLQRLIGFQFGGVGAVVPDPQKQIFTGDPAQDAEADAILLHGFHGGSPHQSQKGHGEPFPAAAERASGIQSFPAALKLQRNIHFLNEGLYIPEENRQEPPGIDTTAAPRIIADKILLKLQDIPDQAVAVLSGTVQPADLTIQFTGQVGHGAQIVRLDIEKAAAGLTDKAADPADLFPDPGHQHDCIGTDVVFCDGNGRVHRHRQIESAVILFEEAVQPGRPTVGQNQQTLVFLPLGEGEGTVGDGLSDLQQGQFCLCRAVGPEDIAVLIQAEPAL